MLTRRVVTARHPDNNEIYGLKPLWLASAEPFDGIGCAHDMLEHAPSDRGGGDGELMALGTSWRIRGETGWFLSRSYLSAEEVYGNLVGGVLVEIAGNGGSPGEPGMTRPLDETDEHAIAVIVDMAVRILETHCEQYEISPPASDIRMRVAGFLRRGMRLANRRYGPGNLGTVESAFNAIGRTVDAALAYLTGAGQPEGLEIAVSADIAAARVFVRTIEPDKEWMNDGLAALAS